MVAKVQAYNWHRLFGLIYEITIIIAMVGCLIIVLFTGFTNNNIHKHVIINDEVEGKIILNQLDRSIEYDFKTIKSSVNKIILLQIRKFPEFSVLVELCKNTTCKRNDDDHFVYGTVWAMPDGGSLRQIIIELNKNWKDYRVYVETIPIEKNDESDKPSDTIDILINKKEDL